jgi:hypothetical protein
MRTPLALAVAFVIVLHTPQARAGDLDLAATAGGLASGWDGDAAAVGATRLGYRFHEHIAADFRGSLGVASVDDRTLTHFSVGVTFLGALGPTRPHARLAIVHQHEEPYAAITADPLGAILGVGDGIRHRAGAHAGLGIDVPLRALGHGWFARAEALATYFWDARGPAWYAGGELGLGYRWSL